MFLVIVLCVTSNVVVVFIVVVDSVNAEYPEAPNLHWPCEDDGTHRAFFLLGVPSKISVSSEGEILSRVRKASLMVEPSFVIEVAAVVRRANPAHGAALNAGVIGSCCC